VKSGLPFVSYQCIIELTNDYPGSQKSRISQKLLGFVNHAGINSKADAAETEQVEAEQQNAFMSRHISALSIVETFLERLTCTSREGKVIIEWPRDSSSNAGGDAMFRFVQIHSASLLDGMVEEAYAIILAGGTLRCVDWEYEY
jgi:hypothetical protein